MHNNIILLTSASKNYYINRLNLIRNLDLITFHDAGTKKEYRSKLTIND